MTLEVVVAPSHLEVLTIRAAQSQLTLRGFVAEIIESYCATLLLPSVVPSGGKAGGAVTQADGEGDLEEGNFPWPADVYRLHSPRAG